ncbi:MAG: YidC/Oxa1 family membrane protein insertase [Patescibacteria group bacterium]|nr:YidC/Oxa1 family membrane protein insertase [Patescibacteria group bacterium]
MANLFNKFLYAPLLSALVFLYENIPGHDLGIAIIVLTIAIRIVLLPLFYKGAKDQAIMQRLAPRIKEIQKDHKDDRAKQAQALMDLYREHKVNPMSQFLIILIQLPILIALYWVFLKGIPANGELSHYFLGIIDLSKRSFIIVILAALAQYFQGKLSLSKMTKRAEELSPMEKMGRQMVFIGPVLTIMFLSYLPSAVGLYWLTTSVFSAIQQIAINKRLAKADEEKLIEMDKKLHHKNGKN